ncbi:MAG: type IV secretory system conjugative DNA transfer family protein [Streptosporangiaceae bacterium]
MTVPLPLTALAGAAAVAGWAWWALAPARHVPRFRVWSMRMRLRLRVHPVTGTASLAALQWHWSRWACWRRSRLARSSMPWWARALQPAAHSIFLGRAQHRHGVRVPVEEHVLLLAPPRSGKTAALTAIVQTYPGPVVMTSTKADVISLTGAARALGGPVWVFNPMRIGGVPSNLRWDPVAGCQDPATAIRRADAFASAVNVRGTEDPSFWSSKAAGWLRALFCAAALDGGGMRTVAAWALGSAERAEQILEAHGHGQWAVELAELRGEAQKTVATVRMVLARALQFLNSPQLAECVEPAAGDNVLDPDGFLSSRATLYMLSDHAGDDAPLAPLYAAMIAEIHYTAQLTGSSMPGGRLDPPLLLARLILSFGVSQGCDLRHRV